MNPSAETPTRSFKSQKDWETWLGKNHEKSTGLWLKIAKKDSGIKSISYPEALESALCYGWIDGQKKAFDETAWLQKFTPRRPRSIWSKINREKISALIKQKRMKPAGLKAVENAKQNGRWDAAYESQSRIEAPSDFRAALDADKKAKAFYETLNSANRYAILFRLHHAKKAETRANKILDFVEMLRKGEKFHP